MEGKKERGKERKRVRKKERKRKMQIPSSGPSFHEFSLPRLFYDWSKISLLALPVDETISH